ncbi:MAG: pilus assembly protein N-terminal domain-containing protein [Hyphomicrobiales bacterium]
MRKVFNLCRSGLLLTAGVMTLGVIAAAPAAMAGQPLTVEVDQSQMIVLPAVPGSVVIGNPTFADATVEGTKLFVHGRTFGDQHDRDGRQWRADGLLRDFGEPSRPTR